MSTLIYQIASRSDKTKQVNSLQIWAAEIDMYHAVVASHEAEVHQIQAEGKPGFQGQRAWDKLGWAWKKMGSSPS